MFPPSPPSRILEFESVGLREKRQSYHSKVAPDITPGDITPGDITAGDICGPVTMGWPLFWAEPSQRAGLCHDRRGVSGRQNPASSCVNQERQIPGHYWTDSHSASVFRARDNRRFLSCPIVCTFPCSSICWPVWIQAFASAQPSPLIPRWPVWD